MESDERLLKQIKAGDREALAVLYGRYLPTVWRYVYAQLRGDDQISRDVVSETFLAAIRNLTRTDAPIANVGGWLIGIARHKVNDCRRLAFKKIGPEESDIHSTVDDPALLLEPADTRWMVAQVMDRMDDLDRTVLEWKYIEELSAREIAERLNRTEKAVEAMLYRARNSFRELFDKMDGTNP